MDTATEHGRSARVDALPTGAKARSLLRTRRFAAIVLLALVVRIAWGLAVPVEPLSDGLAYDTFARHLAAGMAYGWDGETPSAYWPVGTAFIYSLAYRLFHPELWGYSAVIALNVLAGTAIMGLGALLAARWFGGAAGLLTGLLLAFWPMHVQFTTVLASELFFTAFCLGGILAWPERRDARLLLLTGLLFAAAAYIRPTGLLVPAVLAGASVLRSGGIAAVAARWTAVTAVMLVAIVPWSLRNTEAFGEFVLISTNGGANLWMGNSPGTKGEYRPLPGNPAHLNEAEFDRLLKQEAIDFIRSDPLAFACRSAVRIVRLHERETIGIRWNIEGLRRVMPDRSIDLLKWGSQVYWLAVLGMGLAGVALLALRTGISCTFSHPALLIWMYFTAVHAVTVHQDRYHFPVTPFIGALAAVATLAVWGWYHSHKRGGVAR
jgi:hypothetical protein